MTESIPLPITGFYASLCGFILVYLALLVINERRSGRVSLGIGDDNPALERATRAFGNYTEYVPLAILLLAIAELNQIHVYVLHVAGILLLFGRMAHAYGLRHHPGPSWQRVWGMLATFACVLVLSSANLFLLY
jgi:uncharacterized membrane protein YecN with MAPEG domain